MREIYNKILEKVNHTQTTTVRIPAFCVVSINMWKFMNARMLSPQTTQQLIENEITKKIK